MPQSTSTRARSVVSRNCEPVTVVAPPRNWMSMVAMVPGRPLARVSSRPMDLAAVERAYAELLAAFGDLLVAETRGAPVDPAVGSIAALRRRYRALRPKVEAGLAKLAVEEVVDEGDTRAIGVMRGVLPWFDEIEPPPAPRGATHPHPPTASVDVAETRARTVLYRRFGEAAASIRCGDETLH